MKKTENDLIEKFKQIETKILDELKLTNLDVDYNAESKVIVSGLKAYIKKIKKIEEILDEYEEISHKLEKMMGEDEKQKNITDAVVELREDSEELKNEIKNINGQVTVTKKKKTTKASVKEF